jgi:hypothetical protein
MKTKLKRIRAKNNCDGCWYDNQTHRDFCPVDLDGELKCVDKNDNYFIFVKQEELKK